MLFKTVAFYLGCAAASLVLLPLLAAAGAIALVSYAVFSEISETFFGHREESLDTSTAREIAHRLCAGH